MRENALGRKSKFFVGHRTKSFMSDPEVTARLWHRLGWPAGRLQSTLSAVGTHVLWCQIYCN